MAAPTPSTSQAALPASPRPLPFQVALLNPIENPDLKLAIVMLIVPFFVNVSALLPLCPVCSLPLKPQVLSVPALTVPGSFCVGIRHLPVPTLGLKMAGLLPPGQPCPRASVQGGGSGDSVCPLHQGPHQGVRFPISTPEHRARSSTHEG